MDVLGEAIARDRRSDAPALRAPTVGRRYDYRRFCTSAWKSGNFLRHLGVRNGAGVAIAADPLPEPVVTFYGAALLGGVVRFGHDPDVSEEVRALVVATADLDGYEVGPATKRVAYGEAPTDPAVSYFERDVWSENPTEPPDSISSKDPLLWTPERTYTHGELLAAAETAGEALSLEPGLEVGIEGSFSDPSVVAAGLIAPIVAGAVVVLDADGECDVTVDGSSLAQTALFEGL